MLTDDGLAGRRVRRRVVNEQMVAPEIIDLEVTSAVRRLVRKEVLSEDAARVAIADLGALPIGRESDTPLLPRIWELRHNVTPYDAAYVALAEQAGVTLVTGDARLTGASGPRCTFELFGSSWSGATP